MFAELPKSIQKEVLHYLKLDDFVKAKALHDEWLKNCCAHLQTDSQTSHVSDLETAS